MELTDTMLEVIKQAARTIPLGQRSKAGLKASKIFHGSSSEEEFIQKIKEAFPEAFKE